MPRPRPIFADPAELAALIEKAVERGVQRALESAAAGISSRGEKEDPCDDPGSTDHTNIEGGGETSLSTKPANRLLSRMRQGKRPSERKPTPRRSTQLKTG